MAKVNPINGEAVNPEKFMKFQRNFSQQQIKKKESMKYEKGQLPIIIDNQLYFYYSSGSPNPHHSETRTYPMNQFQTQC